MSAGGPSSPATAPIEQQWQEIVSHYRGHHLQASPWERSKNSHLTQKDRNLCIKMVISFVFNAVLPTPIFIKRFLHKSSFHWSWKSWLNLSFPIEERNCVSLTVLNKTAWGSQTNWESWDHLGKIETFRVRGSQRSTQELIMARGRLF